MESILDSVKKQLGLVDVNEFDQEIIMHINGAIATLKQLGVGPQEETFIVSNKEDTYVDYLGGNLAIISEVKLYLFYKTKLGFDPPQSSAVTEVLKEMISETEWRLNVFATTKRDD